MSAFICSDLHIATIAKHVSDYFKLDCQELADKLKAINIQSVNYRYNEKTRKTKCNIGIKSNILLTLDDVAKLIDSFNYQACEELTPDFKAYSIMLETWINESGAQSKNGKHWTI